MHHAVSHAPWGMVRCAIGADFDCYIPDLPPSLLLPMMKGVQANGIEERKFGLLFGPHMRAAAAGCPEQRYHVRTRPGLDPPLHPPAPAHIRREDMCAPFSSHEQHEQRSSFTLTAVVTTVSQPLLCLPTPLSLYGCMKSLHQAPSPRHLGHSEPPTPTAAVSRWLLVRVML